MTYRVFAPDTHRGMYTYGDKAAAIHAAHRHAAQSGLLHWVTDHRGAVLSVCPGSHEWHAHERAAWIRRAEAHNTRLLARIDPLNERAGVESAPGPRRAKVDSRAQCGPATG